MSDQDRNLEHEELTPLPKKSKTKSVSFKISESMERKMASQESTMDSRSSRRSHHQNLSVLDKKSARMLNYPMTVSQQLWMLFLIPSLIRSFIYIMDLSTDIAVGLALLSHRHVLAGLATLLVTYSPPIICFIIKLMNPPEEKTFVNIVKWLVHEILGFFFFPLRPIFCFGERLFWSIEALRQEDPLREEALVSHEQTKTSTIELYLFLQAYLHALPQAILQLIFIVLGTSSDPHTQEIQGLCFITSLTTVALTTSSYHRYEAQVNGGRQRMWIADEDRAVAAGQDEPLSRGPQLDPLLNEPSAVDTVDNRLQLPKPRKWVKAMDPEDPIGLSFAFAFWYLLVFARCICLVIAVLFVPWVVLGICIFHYLFCLLYILPSPTWKSSVPSKLLLCLVYIFCLIEVGVHFRKAHLLYTLYFVFTTIENLVMTLVWVLWSNWRVNWWNYYCLYLMGIAYGLAIVFLIIYMKYFRPKVRRLKPNF